MVERMNACLKPINKYTHVANGNATVHYFVLWCYSMDKIKIALKKANISPKGPSMFPPNTHKSPKIIQKSTQII